VCANLARGRYHAYSTDALVAEVLDGYAATATPLGTVRARWWWWWAAAVAAAVVVTVRG
jgi:hypothetical protein